MKRFKYLAFLLWMMPLAFGACTDDDNEEITDEEYIAGAAVVNLTVVDGETDLPIAAVTLKQTALKISETTDAHGKATLRGLSLIWYFLMKLIRIIQRR